MKHTGNLEITKDNQNNYKDLTEVTGDLYVDGSAKLDALQTVGGYLHVYGSAKLDAAQLQTVGGYLHVYGSAKLDALQTVGGDLYVDGSAKLDAAQLQTVGGDLYVDGSANIPNLKQEKPTPEVIHKIKTEPYKAVQNNFERQGYLLADGICQSIISKKTTGALTIYKTKKIAGDKISYVIYDGVNYSHGETLKKAKEDLKFKISSRDTSLFKEWKLTDVKPVEDLIKAYRVITGACEFGTKEFCNSQELKSEYSIKEVIKMTSGKFGNEQFKQFFN